MWKAANAATFVIGLTCAIAAVPSDAGAESWTALREQNFPGQVTEVVWSQGSKIDGVAAVKFGQWQLGFGPEPPVADEYLCQPNYMNNEHCFFVIRGLVASNALAGSKDVDLVLRRAPVKPQRLLCHVTLPPVDSSDPLARAGRNLSNMAPNGMERPIMFDVPCPESVNF